MNGSPRKKWNTDQMLDAAVKGAESAGVQCEKIHLYDYEYKGCISCFACKVKGSKTNGLCAYKDALRPVLEKAREADMIIIGTPLYYSYPTGQTRSFMERLMFPVGTYLWENGKQILIRDKVIPTGIIYTMNLPRDLMEEADYPVMLKDNELSMNQIFGYCESLYICDTYQFRDYSRYDINLFDPEQKAEHRKQFFQKELESAYEFGRRIALMIPDK